MIKRADQGTVSLAITEETSKNGLTPSFYGFAFEMDEWWSSLSFPQGRNFYEAMSKQSGVMPTLRFGGNSADHRMNDLGTFEKYLKKLHQKTNGTYKMIVTLNLLQGKRDFMIKQAQIAKRILGNQLLYVELGNEPNLYDKIWNFKGSGIRERLPPILEDHSKAIKQAVPGVNTICGAYSNDGVQHLEQTMKVAKSCDAYSFHWYKTQVKFRNQWVDHRRITSDPRFEFFRRPTARLDTLSGDKSLFITEVNTVNFSGTKGVSDAFVAAKFAVLGAIEAAVHGVNRAYFQTGDYKAYTCIDRVAHSNPVAFQARPLFYGMYAMTSFIGKHGNLGIVGRVAKSDYSVYTFQDRSSDKKKMVLIDNRTPGFQKQEFQVQFPTTFGIRQGTKLSIKILSQDADGKVRYAGITFGNNGRIEGKVTTQAGKCGENVCSFEAPTGSVVFGVFK
jgi:hypothetical protein